MIVGSLTAVGGPAPGDGRPVAGRFIYTDRPDQMAEVDVPASGEFRVEVEPGTYNVGATFGNDLACDGPNLLDVAEGEEEAVEFICQMR